MRYHLRSRNKPLHAPPTCRKRSRSTRTHDETVPLTDSGLLQDSIGWSQPWLHYAKIVIDAYSRFTDSPCSSSDEDDPIEKALAASHSTPVECIQHFYKRYRSYEPSDTESEATDNE